MPFGKLREFRALSPEERSLFLRAAYWLPMVSLKLRLFGLRPFQPGPSRRCGSSLALPPEEVAIRAERTRRYVELAARHGLCRGTCLSRSLTLWWLLKQQGIDSELRIGVHRMADGIRAHAWIEHQGVVLNDQPDVRTRFTPFDQPLLHHPTNCRPGDLL
jgi:hypothetical protein